MANRLLYYDDVNERVVRSDKDPAIVGTGGAIQRAGQDGVTSGVTSKVVTIAPAMPDGTFAVIATWQNTVDTSPVFQPIVITAQSTTSFTAKWNDPTDSASYEINWLAIDI